MPVCAVEIAFGGRAAVAWLVYAIACAGLAPSRFRQIGKALEDKDCGLLPKGGI